MSVSCSCTSWLAILDVCTFACSLSISSTPVLLKSNLHRIVRTFSAVKTVHDLSIITRFVCSSLEMHKYFLVYWPNEESVTAVKNEAISYLRAIWKLVQSVMWQSEGKLTGARLLQEVTSLHTCTMSLVNFDRYGLNTNYRKPVRNGEPGEAVRGRRMDSFLCVCQQCTKPLQHYNT